MNQVVTVKTKGQTIKVKMPYFDNEHTYLEMLKDKVRDGERGFSVLWEDESAAPEDSLKDIEDMQRILTRIEAIPDSLAVNIDSIRKKKNGGLWKNSGTDIFVSNHCTEYFTDFTNAWSAYVIRLHVIDEGTCELVLTQRTFTH